MASDPSTMKAGAPFSTIPGGAARMAPLPAQAFARHSPRRILNHKLLNNKFLQIRGHLVGLASNGRCGLRTIMEGLGVSILAAKDSGLEGSFVEVIL